MSSFATVARPYAQAAFNYAAEQSALPAWERALQFAAHVARDDAVQRLIGDPRVADDALIGLFRPEDMPVPDGFENFLALLERNGRLPTLPDIAEQFTARKDEAEQTLAVTVRTAAELDDQHRERLQQALAKRFGKNIDLRVQVDEDMVGGASIQAGDLVIDGTVRDKISRLAASLSSH
ncbi:MAG: F0F1 ATP synthase subunit delta [Xanthomonadales bacterium]|nr:F0F1 ATP synthase subunit delta [Xanthomonadales bacterium]